MIDYVFEIIFHLIYILKTIIFDDIIIKTTKEHPFWVEGQSWTKAKFLESSDELRDASGNTITIENVDIVPLPENQYTLVYNFEVADFHTYYVADSYVLAHNTKDCLKVNPKNIDFPQRSVSGNVKRYTQDMVDDKWIWRDDNIITLKIENTKHKQ